MHYLKLYHTLKTGTLAAEGGFALALWPLFMMEADWDGVVEVHPGVLAVKWTGLGRFGSFTEDQVRKVLEYWEQPDPHSRSPVDEGRRISRLHAHRDWGWQIVNWAQYRDAEGEEAKREKARERKRRERERQRHANGVTGRDRPRDCHPQRTENRERRKDPNPDNSSPVDTSEATDGVGSPGELVLDDSPKRPPNCPHEQIVELYHKILPELPRVLEWNERRRGYLNTAWKAKPKRQQLEYWRLFFEFVRQSDLLMGKVPRKDSAPWRADLEWLVKPANFLKINEKKYHHDE